MSFDLTFIGDPHAKNDNLDNVSKVYDLAESLGNTVITLGDLLDTKSIVQSKCLNFYIKKLSESKLQHYILVGNHDYHNNECLEHSLEPLKRLSNVVVVDKPTVIGNMLLAPYYNDLEKFRKEILNHPNKESTIVIIHQGVTGFDYGNGFMAENEINLEELQGFKRVISGHFHKCQLKGNLVYPGTPFSHSFGESNQSKCIAQLDSDTGHLNLINTNLPQHKTLILNCDNVDELSTIYTFTPNDFHRVILTGKEQNIHKFQKKLYPTVKFIEQPTVEESGNAIKESDSPEEIFLKWARDIKKLDDKTISIGLGIIKETI